MGLRTRKGKKQFKNHIITCVLTCIDETRQPRKATQGDKKQRSEQKGHTVSPRNLLFKETVLKKGKNQNLNHIYFVGFSIERGNNNQSQHHDDDER